MAVSAQVANKATLNLILGVFLKLLGFFVIMYTYTDTDPMKARQAEESIRQRFNISISLLDEKNGTSEEAFTQVMQENGRAFTRIKDDLKTQVDFLSTQYMAKTGTLILTLPADIAIPIGDQPAKSPQFANILTDTLQTQRSEKYAYALEVIVKGQDDQALMQEISLFIEKMIAEGYPKSLLTIGYASLGDAPEIELRVRQVKQ